MDTQIIKNNYQFLILLIFAFALPLSLKAAVTDSVHLAGVLTVNTPGFNGGFFNCKVIEKNAGDNEAMFSKNFQVIIKNNHFNIAVPANSDLFYVVFSLTDTAGKTKELFSRNSTEAYLLQKGDNINLRIGDAYLGFSGKGAERLSCQYYLYSLLDLPEDADRRYCELISDKNYSEGYAAVLKMMNIQLSMKKVVLNTYQHILPASIINRLYIDCVGRLYFDSFYSLYSSHQKNLYEKRYLNELSTALGTADTSSAALSSLFYSQSLLYKELATLKFQGNTDTFESFSFKQLFDSIRNNYKGRLRDKILLQAFVAMAGRNNKEDMFRYIDEALSIMGNDESKAMLQEWSDKVAIGKNAYPFDLQGENGKRYRLHDFKGKIIVADFWFTGCMGCTQMPGSLKLVHEKYNTDDRIVWLSICIDKSAKWWHYGLKTGLYTIPGEINLFTDGKGFAHPLLAHYGYASFPQLLIIDQQGATASAFPPDPRIDKGEKLMNLLDRLLK